MIHCGDNLEIMRSMDDGSIDLIYLDPPFNSKRNYGEFDDRWSGDGEYIDFMTARLVQCHRLLANTGSIYLHCDPTMSHYLKVVMDTIWGRSNFRNEIIWCYTGSNNVTRRFPRKHDTILFYAQSEATGFNADAVRVPYKIKKVSTRSNSRNYTDEEKEALSKRGKVVESWWADIPNFGTATGSKERVGYPTQKPLKLLERIIAASSNPGDTVFDPFCGSGTTLVAAQRLGRLWVGCDMSANAIAIAKKRLDEVS